MCFSAEASFIAGTVLLATGVASVRKITSTEQLPFASIPFIFALQQFSEGFLWLSFMNPGFERWKELLTHIFLVFAQVIWPSWIPLAFLLIEKYRKRRMVLILLSGIGFIISAFSFYSHVHYPVSSEISSHHVYYKIAYPESYEFGKVLYFIVTIIPPFISGIRWTWIIGLLNLMTFLISVVFFKDHVISIWCFMAAVLSVSVLLIMMKVLAGKPPSPRNELQPGSLTL